MFLNQPLIEGSSEFSRGLFVMSAMFYPEGYMWRSWTDEGRLPLAFFDRLPILAATVAWLGSPPPSVGHGALREPASPRKIYRQIYRDLNI